MLPTFYISTLLDILGLYFDNSLKIIYFDIKEQIVRTSGREKILHPHSNR